MAGAQGQIARSLVEAAEEHGIFLAAIGRPELDLTKPDTLSRSIEKVRPDFVINAAAYTAVDKAEDNSNEAFSINQTGAGFLSAACSKFNIPVVHLSTDYVFDGTKDTAYSEQDITAPLGVYGHSKLKGEKAVSTANPNHLILRTAWVYSPFGNNFVKVMLKLGQTRDQLSVVDDQLGSPTYAPHLARCILQLIDHQHKSGQADRFWGIYNIAGSGAATWCGLAREIFKISSDSGGPVARVSPITTAEYPTSARRPANSRLDCSRLKEIFNITMPKWQDGVVDCIKRLL